jgi:hypothetical protein
MPAWTPTPRRGFNPRDFDLGHKLRLLDGEHDMFGDGSVVCLPTHGHTPGVFDLPRQIVRGRRKRQGTSADDRQPIHRNDQ